MKLSVRRHRNIFYSQEPPIGKCIAVRPTIFYGTYTHTYQPEISQPIPEDTPPDLKDLTTESGTLLPAQLPTARFSRNLI
jgi:hypothetical protein